ncbi:toxin-antitoxin system YwqK family antitoxin [Fusobacterium canifelinum]|uniref:Toxin-antitoxin system YwqK family antitoxin n=1 Tax=Fusobacterium canifelinum TaxID=285729 RepID=A0A3P1V3L8_9FUSO|nr:toxin-antitoxin system YwqK family antitoxin [Fusobacterium canifelinum]RRD28681.1 toxin-antitoxin system YwqK family antitoxin [Fusobacterium canifelinum]
MKKNFIIYTLIIFILSSFSIFAQREVNYRDLKYNEETELMYFNDEKEPFTGIAKDYYEDKTLKAEVPYVNGMLEGLGKQYYPSGKLKSEANFVEGLFQGKATGYYENGNLEYEENYKDGQLDGLTKNYYKNGNIEYEENYKDNELDGLVKKYYENGQLCIEENYKDGKLEGEIVYYDENGNIELKAIYKDDKVDKVIDVDTGEEIQTEENKSEKYLEYSIFVGIIVLWIYFIIFKLKSFPKTSHLSDEQREKILKILIQHDENKKELFSTFKFNGIGTGYSEVGSMMIDEQRVYIKAKIFSIIFIPVPKILGYLLCYGEDEILASYSNKTFKELKKEIKETVLYM